ncbi:hypothetical protein JCM10212_000952 [Sporobolomyces blumeae]
MDALRSVTASLPTFISDPISSLVTPTCYRSLVLDLDLTDTECLSLTLSKLVGVGIITGSAVVKVPQIVAVLKSRSAAGLSLESYVLDTAATLITVAYNTRNRFPFSAYGELVFLLAQNAVLIFLITSYTPGPTLSRVVPLTLVFSLLAYSLSTPAITPPTVLSTLQTLTIPLSLSSKVPQIAANYRDKSTGQLSTFLVVNSLAGCVARTLTSWRETRDVVLVVGFAAAAVLNAVIAAQMWYYHSNSAIARDSLVTRKNEEVEKELVKVKASMGTSHLSNEQVDPRDVSRGTPSSIGNGFPSPRAPHAPSASGGAGVMSTPVRKVSQSQAGGGGGGGASRTASPASANGRRYVRKLD